jgi:hypothetical protein
MITTCKLSDGVKDKYNKYMKMYPRSNIVPFVLSVTCVPCNEAIEFMKKVLVLTPSQYLSLSVVFWNALSTVLHDWTLKCVDKHFRVVDAAAAALRV